MSTVVVIVGPTGVGKSDAAVAFATRRSGEIVSADSMQVYTGMDIGTAKPSLTDREAVPHHLIDVLDPGEKFSVAAYQELARAAISRIHSSGNVPILVGGTGLYVDAVIRGFLFPEQGERRDIRDRLAAEAEAIGTPALHGRLSQVDPTAAGRIHKNDLRRIVRALEVFEITGTPISELQRKHKGERAYDARQFGLTMARDRLNARIDQRVDKMMRSGLLDEVRKLADKGYGDRLTSMQAIGYKELIAYLEGTLTLEAAITLIKQESRKYAKRQMTWFRKSPDIVWLDVDEFGGPLGIAAEIERTIWK